MDLSLTDWIKDINSYLPQTPTILVGTKSDLEGAIAVTREEAEFAAQEAGPFPYVETSSKDGRGVQQAFQMLGEMIYKHR